MAVSLNVKFVSDGTKAHDKSENTGTGHKAPRASDHEAKAPKANDHRAVELTRAEQAQVRQLQARDRAVRAHEQAHMAAGAGIAGAPTYTYQTGPDGRRYAVGGEVAIRANPSSSDPEAAIRQLKQVVRAALAPATPSYQDRAVAAAAQAKTASLQARILKETSADSAEDLEATENRLPPSTPLLAYRRADQLRFSGADAGFSGAILDLVV